MKRWLSVFVLASVLVLPAAAAATPDAGPPVTAVTAAAPAAAALPATISPAPVPAAPAASAVVPAPAVLPDTLVPALFKLIGLATGGQPWFVVIGLLLFVFVRVGRGQAGFNVPKVTALLDKFTGRGLSAVLDVLGIVGGLLVGGAAVPPGSGVKAWALYLASGALQGLLATVLGAGVNSKVDAQTKA